MTRISFGSSLFFFCSALLLGQGLTGQLSGTVTDSSGGAIGNANVQVINSQTQQLRSTKSGSDGRFVFTELLPGDFSLTIDSSGFKKFQQTGVRVSATERVVLPTIVLEVGAVTETVAVTGQVAAVQTESAERSGLITSREMQEIPLKGRSYIGTTKLLPGIIDTANRESPGWNDLLESISTARAPERSISISMALPVSIPARLRGHISRPVSTRSPK